MRLGMQYRNETDGNDNIWMYGNGVAVLTLGEQLT